MKKIPGNNMPKICFGDLILKCKSRAPASTKPASNNFPEIYGCCIHVMRGVAGNVG